MSHIFEMVPGPAGNLEVIVEEPSEHARPLLGIICHPHPLQSGTMSNKVVTTLAKVFTRIGAIAIRFNFRGVGRSEGQHDFAVGELDDLRAVISWASQRYPNYQLLLAGFSFGSYIATKVATQVHPAVLISVAPPVHHNDFKALPPIDFPWILIQGEADEVVPPGEVFAWIETLSIKPQLIKMPNVGHFFHGELINLRDTLIVMLKSLLKLS